MTNWLLNILAIIGKIPICILRKIASSWNSLKGEKSLRILAIHDDPKEAYILHTTTGGIVAIHCAERTYRLKYEAWWYPNHTYRSYKVYGKCTGDVPARLAILIGRGITLGAMLPAILPRERQKQEAIHLYASYLVHELEKQKEY